MAVVFIGLLVSNEMGNLGIYEEGDNDFVSLLYRMLASGNYILPLWPVSCDRRTGPAPHPMNSPPAPYPLVNIGKFKFFFNEHVNNKCKYLIVYTHQN